MNLDLELRLQTYLTDAVDVMRRAYELGWISTRDGNISVAANDPGHFFISPSGVVKYRLTAGQFVMATTIRRATPTTETGKPSGELELHRRLQHLQPRPFKTILHLHPTYLIAALYAGYRLPELAANFPEVTRYSRVGADVPALPATSEELAISCARAFSPALGPTPHIVGLDRHGVVAIGRNPWDAFEHVERLEHICKIVLAAGRPNALAQPTFQPEALHEQG